MNHLHQHDSAEPHVRRGRWVLIGFTAIAAIFLWSEHRAHLLGVLPYLLVLACPLMHIFHHGRHRHGTDDPSRQNRTAQAGKEESP